MDCHFWDIDVSHIIVPRNYFPRMTVHTVLCNDTIMNLFSKVFWLEQSSIRNFSGPTCTCCNIAPNYHSPCARVKLQGYDKGGGEGISLKSRIWARIHMNWILCECYKPSRTLLMSHFVQSWSLLQMVIVLSSSVSKWANAILLPN